MLKKVRREKNRTTLCDVSNHLKKLCARPIAGQALRLRRENCLAQAKVVTLGQPRGQERLGHLREPHARLCGLGNETRGL